MKYIIVMLLALSPLAHAEYIISGDVDVVKGCKIGKIRIDFGGFVDTIATVVRCPNSTVSTTTIEKHPVKVITVDGVKYQEIKK